MQVYGSINTKRRETHNRSTKGYRDVRFAPESRHVQCTTQCPLWANSGHEMLFNHFIGAPEKRQRDSEAERLGCFEIQD